MKLCNARGTPLAIKDNYFNSRRGIHLHIDPQSSVDSSEECSTNKPVIDFFRFMVKKGMLGECMDSFQDLLVICY